MFEDLFLVDLKIVLVLVELEIVEVELGIYMVRFDQRSDDGFGVEDFLAVVFSKREQLLECQAILLKVAESSFNNSFTQLRDFSVH